MIALPAPRHPATAMVLAALALVLLPRLPLGVQLTVCVPLVALLGLPHGATDWWIAAENLPRLLGRREWFIWAPVFGFAYLLACAVAAGAVLLAPAAALIIFVAISAWHFGQTDLLALGMDARPVLSMATGLLPIAAPALFWPGDVATLLAALHVGLAPHDVWLAGAAGVAVALLLPRFIVAHGSRLAAEQVAYLLLAAAATPLFGFLIYFCCIHAPRQAAQLHVGGSAVVAWAAAGVAALLLALLFFGPASAGASMPQHAVQALFWGLAVLTLPHFLCGWLLGAGHGDFTQHTTIEVVPT